MNAAALPAYVAPVGIPEAAARLHGELAALLKPFDDRDAETARLNAELQKLEERKGQKKLDALDRAAIVEAAADRMQADALRERLQALETEDHDRPIVKFLHDIPPFYEKALRGYQREIVTLC